MNSSRDAAGAVLMALALMAFAMVASKNHIQAQAVQSEKGQKIGVRKVECLEVKKWKRWIREEK